MRLTQLQSVIDKAAQLYYTPGCTPSMSDSVYDQMLDELRAIAPDDPRLTRVGVPYSADQLRDKKPHKIPMGSLDKTKGGIDGFSEWYRKFPERTPINVSLKMDGNSVAINYVDGVLAEAISRGDGEVGEDLTANAVKWIGVPTILPEPFTGTVRGEAILFKKEFKKVGGTNPRNAGSGILGRLDGTDNELIHFVAFNIVGADCPSVTSKLCLLAHYGFEAVHYLAITEDAVDQVRDYFEEVAAKRNELPFEIDGIVAMVDDVSLHDSALRPKHGCAIKFETAKEFTTVTGVTITVGHTGAIVPTAVVDPVFVGGVTVTNVALNNWNADSEYPSAAHVAIGDIVEVSRHGDVIPKIISVEEVACRQPIEMPATCPVCGAPTVKTGAVLYCTNLDCEGRAVKKIKHFLSVVEIQGIGDAVLEALPVDTPADLYRLTLDQLATLKTGEVRLGKKRALSILSEIRKAKTLPLDKFLGALGIKLLGRRRVEVIAKEQGLTTLGDWLDPEKLKAISGDVVRRSIVDGVQEMRPVIDDLLSFVVVEPLVVASGSLSGKSFCWTGCRDYIDEVAAQGGIIKSGVSKGLDYLVQKTASSSSKTKKAEALGVKVIDLNQLREMLK
jgi:DNA ligase (NAD+)